MFLFQATATRRVFVDLQYEELMKDPVAAVRRIYESFGETMTQEVLMNKQCQTSKQVDTLLLLIIIERKTRVLVAPSDFVSAHSIIVPPIS